MATERVVMRCCKMAQTPVTLSWVAGVSSLSGLHFGAPAFLEMIMSSDNNLDSILINILGEKKPADTTTIGDTVKFVPSTPAVAEPVAKPTTERKLRDPVEGKVEIEGASNEIVKGVTYFPKGYATVTLHLHTQKIWGYGRGIKPVLHALLGAAAPAVIAKLEALGLRD